MDIFRLVFSFILIVFFSIRWHFDVVAVIDIPFPSASCFLSKQWPTQPNNPESKISLQFERFLQIATILQKPLFSNWNILKPEGKVEYKTKYS